MDCLGDFFLLLLSWLYQMKRWFMMCMSYSSLSNTFKSFGVFRGAEDQSPWKWLLWMNEECGWGVKDHFYYTHLVLYIQQVYAAAVGWAISWAFSRFFLSVLPYQCTLSLPAEMERCSCSTSNLYKQIVCKRSPVHSASLFCTSEYL